MDPSWILPCYIIPSRTSYTSRRVWEFDVIHIKFWTILEPWAFYSFPWSLITEAYQQIPSHFVYISVEKGGSKIDLLGFESELNFDNEHQSHGCPLDYWSICFEEINPLQLHVTSVTETCLKIIYQSIWVALQLECPCWLNDIHIIFTINNFPSINGL